MLSDDPCPRYLVKQVETTLLYDNATAYMNNRIDTSMYKTFSNNKTNSQLLLFKSNNFLEEIKIITVFDNLK